MWPERSPGRGSGALPAEALGRARVDDLCAVVRERHAYVGKHRDGADIHIGSEFSRRPRGVAFLQRPPFGFPLRQPAVEDVDFLRAEQPERPPHPRRRIEADAVIHDDSIAVADAERTDHFAELRLGRAACAAGRSNDRRPLRCRRIPRRVYGLRDIRRGRRAAASAGNKSRRRRPRLRSRRCSASHSVETSQRLLGEGANVSSGLSMVTIFIDNARASAMFRRRGS